MVEPLVEIEMRPVPTSEDVAGALMEIVAPLVLVDWLKEIGPVPTNAMVPVVKVPVVPAVLPRFETPRPTPPPAPDNTRVCPVTPTETLPAPEMSKLPSDCVPLED